MESRSSVGRLTTREFHTWTTCHTANHEAATCLEILVGQKTCHSQATRQQQKLEIIAVNFQSAFSTLKCLVVRKSGTSSSDFP